MTTLFTTEDCVTFEQQDEEMNDYTDGMLWVDDADAARLAIARELGQPEPELYPNDKMEEFDFSRDEEKALNDLVELSARMDKGKEMISSAKKTIDSFFEKNGFWFIKLWFSWKHREEPMMVTKVTSHWKYPMKEEDVERFLSDNRNKQYIQWFEYRNSLWKQFNKLNKQCAAIKEEYPSIWYHYFQLRDEVITPYDINGDTEEVDNSTIYKGKEEETKEELDVLFFTHSVQEQQMEY